eukprot:Lithocolla_globosa_v1_NODE_27_length_9260_cov_179.654861.p9 type:complete len:102 gc:universal NODE_27_length_9260_cov_179.654861:5021-5326(+)
MTYIQKECIPLSLVRTEIKNGMFNDLTTVVDVKLYKNDKRQWRLKLKLENETKTDTKTVNVLAARDHDSIYVNKKSLDWSAQDRNTDDIDISKIAEDILLG